MDLRLERAHALLRADRYAAADVAVSLSEYEGFGLPALEAAARGVPLVVGEAPSLGEIFGGAAMVVQPRDESAVARALDRVLGEPGLRERLVGAGRALDGLRHSFLMVLVSWVVFAGITITAPLLIVFGAHQIVDEGFLHHQGAMILLLFGWITGAQTLFFVYKIGGERPFLVLFYVILSFGLVVMTYALVGHAFDALLYPDPEFREALYQAASVNFTWFVMVLFLLILLISAGWLLVFHSAAAQEPLERRYRNLYINLYTLLSREFYISGLYSRAGEQLLALSRRLNALLRWV